MEGDDKMNPGDNNMGRDMDNMYKWRKETIKRYELTLHKENDKDVYEKLESIDNKRQYLIELIRKDIEKEA